MELRFFMNFALFCYIYALEAWEMVFVVWNSIHCMSLGLKVPRRFGSILTGLLHILLFIFQLIILYSKEEN